MKDWIEYTLGEVAEIQTGPFGSQLHAYDYVTEGTPCIMPQNIGTRLDISLSDIARIRDSDMKRLKKYQVAEGDIVYSRRGDVEKCAYMRHNQNGWLCGTGCLRVRIKEENTDSLFIAYYLSSPDSRAWILNNSVGTTMPNLNTSILQRVPLVLPNLKYQKATSEVLKSLDDKIDLLHLNNHIIEQMAAALFQKRFVEERDESWPQICLGEEFDITMGQSPPGESYNEEGIGSPFYQGRTDFGFRFPTKRIFCTNPKRFAKKLDTLLSVRAPVGDVNMSIETCCIGRGVCAVRHKKDQGLSSYVYYKMKHLKSVLETFEDNGTVFGAINKDDLANISTILPPHDMVQQFQEIANNMDLKIEKNEYQIHSLEQLRDTLLPRLMNGEVTVEL